MTSTKAQGDSLLHYLQVLRERALLIIACTLLVIGAAIAYVQVAPKTYTATAQIEVNAASDSNSVLAGLPVLHQSGDSTQDVLSGAQFVTTPQVAAEVVKQLGLKASANTVLGWVSVSPIGQSDFVAVQAQTDSASLSQRVANAFVTQTIQVTTAQMHSAITAQLPSMQAQLAATPPTQRYGPGALGATVQQLQQLLLENNPTLLAGATASLPTGPSSRTRS